MYGALVLDELLLYTSVGFLESFACAMCWVLC